MKRFFSLLLLALLATTGLYAQTVYSTDHEYQADLLVYFVRHEYQAGWRNNSKKHLMYRKNC